jgi:hypothetical protein
MMIIRSRSRKITTRAPMPSTFWAGVLVGALVMFVILAILGKLAI